MGAILGGRTRPLLSPWVMMMPPMSRVDRPQEVSKGVGLLVVLVGKMNVKGLGKAVPKVVGGTGLAGPCRSCIMHSMA